MSKLFYTMFVLMLFGVIVLDLVACQSAYF